MAQSKTKTPSPSEKDVLRVIREYKQESESSSLTRMRKNKQNWDAYYGNVDWSHKQAGQSTEHLPKLAAATDQMSAFVKRALVQFGDWFSMELPPEAFLTPEGARALLRTFLENIALSRTETGNFYSLMSDAVKQGLLESLLVLKVHGQYMTSRTMAVEPGDQLLGVAASISPSEEKVWRLRVDLIANEDYYPDPTGRKLYEIHTVERDYWDVLESAKDGLYDESVVKKIGEDFERDDERRRLQARHRGQDEATILSFRRRVRIDECWGTLLGRDGRPIAQNVVASVANGRHLIRPPEANPFWHGESPIVAAPILRVPHSTQHKALYDDAVSLNLALDELYNLILDGGIGSVWGVRQVRAGWLDKPEQISGGIAQNETLVISDDAPADAEVVKVVAAGKVPAEAMAVLNLTDREAQAAMKTNDTRLGFLPPRAVKATELLQAEQSSSVVIDALASDLEVDVMEKVLKKSWLTILQFADDIPVEDTVKAIGLRPAFMLSQMSPAERYAVLGRGLGVKVNGLSSTLGRAREFQKFMALQQGIATNPILLEAFVRRMSADKTLDHLMRSLNINPETFAQSPEEQAQTPDRVNRMAALSQVLPSAGGSPPKAGEDRGAMDEARSEMSGDVQGG